MYSDQASALFVIVDLRNMSRYMTRGKIQVSVTHNEEELSFADFFVGEENQSVANCVIRKISDTLTTYPDSKIIILDETEYALGWRTIFERAGGITIIHSAFPNMENLKICHFTAMLRAEGYASISDYVTLSQIIPRPKTEELSHVLIAKTYRLFCAQTRSGRLPSAIRQHEG